MPAAPPGAGPRRGAALPPAGTAWPRTSCGTARPGARAEDCWAPGHLHVIAVLAVTPSGFSAGARKGLEEAVPRRGAHGKLLGLGFSQRLWVTLCFQR